MSEPLEPTATALVPVAPASSLAAPALEDKRVIESWIGDQASPYWRGNEHHSAAWIQATHRNLIRAEQLGAQYAALPQYSPDDDLPATAAGYDFSAAAGANSMNGEDRDIVDRFLPVAHAAGLGRAKVRSAIGWALSIPDLTPDQFTYLAVAANWSDRAIGTCLKWYAAEAARRGGED